MDQNLFHRVDGVTINEGGVKWRVKPIVSSFLRGAFSWCLPTLYDMYIETVSALTSQKFFTCHQKYMGQADRGPAV